MNTFRTIILLTGILVAGLAINTALAQTQDAQPDARPAILVRHDIKPKIKHKVHADKLHKVHLKEQVKNVRQKDRSHKHNMKHEVKHSKTNVNDHDRLIKDHKEIRKTKPVKIKPQKTF